MRHKCVSTIVLLLITGSSIISVAHCDTKTVLLHAFRSDVLVIPVTVGDHDVDFVLDTGASHHVFDKSMAADLSDPIRSAYAKTLTGSQAVSVHHLPMASVCGIPITSRSSEIVCTDLSRISAVTGTDIRGILGVDFLTDKIVSIDCSASRIEMWQSSDTNTSWGKKVPMIFNSNGLPMVKIAGRHVSESKLFLVDTGFTGEIRLPAPDFDRLLDERKLTLDGHIVSATGSGRNQSVAGRLVQFQFFEFMHSNLSVYRGPRASIGLGYLSRYVVTFDFRGHAMYLKESAYYSMPRTSDMSGLHLVSSKGAVVIDEIDARSPAECAGLKVGDEIVVIGNRVAEALSLSSYRRILSSAEGRLIVLVVRRGAEDREVAFRLRLPPWPPLE